MQPQESFHTMMIKQSVLFSLVCATALALEQFPAPTWEDRPSPLASPHAVPGGEIVEFAGQSPKSLNYYLDNNVFSARVFGELYETLLTRNPVDLAYEPYLARSWSISADGRTFTFQLDPRARWSDGTPVTAADVVWTYEAIMDPANLTGVHKVSMERLEPPRIVAPDTVVFQAKEVHWRNLDAAGGFHVLPRHAFADRDFNKINFEFPVVSGPYRLGTFQEAQLATLTRRPDWWRRDFPSSRGLANFDRLTYKFFADRGNAFEAFKKGLIDVFTVYTARRWVKETVGEQFEKNWIVKQKIYNHHPVGFQGFAMNMRQPPFDDVRVRQAMAHLVDRSKMNSRIMYNQYFLHRSYYEDLYDTEHPCPNEIIPFDKETARGLLSAAGWKVNPQTGIRERNGSPFTVKFLTRAASSDPFLAIFGEDLKDAGVELVIDKKDWAAWARDMDEFNYTMTWASWSAGLFKDPEGMWSSREATRRGGNNITGFQDAGVDALIEEQKGIFDVARRHEICRRVDAIVCAQHPYVLLWNLDYVRMLYWSKFGTPAQVLSKYGSESTTYWWYDEDAAAELADARATGNPLPRKPDTVIFDDVFGRSGSVAAAAAPGPAVAAAGAPVAPGPALPMSATTEEEGGMNTLTAIMLIGGLALICLILALVRRMGRGG